MFSMRRVTTNPGRCISASGFPTRIDSSPSGDVLPNHRRVRASLTTCGLQRTAIEEDKPCPISPNQNTNGARPGRTTRSTFPDTTAAGLLRPSIGIIWAGGIGTCAGIGRRAPADGSGRTVKPIPRGLPRLKLRPAMTRFLDASGPAWCPRICNTCWTKRNGCAPGHSLKGWLDPNRPKERWTRKACGAGSADPSLRIASTAERRGSCTAIRHPAAVRQCAG